jgi:NAD-dependent dihydropyrimidine dehydrogenase PreA subunit
MPTRINRALCTDCGDCIFHCGAFVYEFSASGAVKAARPHDCAECMLCLERCRRRAITMFFPRARSPRSTAGTGREAEA